MGGSADGLSPDSWAKTKKSFLVRFLFLHNLHMLHPHSHVTSIQKNAFMVLAAVVPDCPMGYYKRKNWGFQQKITYWP